MKKISISLIIISILFVLISVIIIFTRDNKSQNKVEPNQGEKNKKDEIDDKKDDKKDDKTNIVPYKKEELYGILSDWAVELYGNNNYDKCVKKDDNTCFLSLEGLEKEYGKDISKFKDERGECLLDTSGIDFYLNDNKGPFSIFLEGCRFLDETDPKEEPQ